MSAIETGKVLTASLLAGGTVVFLARNGRWSDIIDEAAVALEPVALEALKRRGREAEAANVVTGTYLIEVERRDGRVVPLRVISNGQDRDPSTHVCAQRNSEGSKAIHNS